MEVQRPGGGQVKIRWRSGGQVEERDPTLPGGQGPYPSSRRTLPYQEERDPTPPG